MERIRTHQPAGGSGQRSDLSRQPIRQWFSKWRRNGVSSGQLPLTREQIDFLLPQVPGWRVEERNGILRLKRTFQFPDLAGALAFAIRAGAIEVIGGHQPALLVDHDSVKVSWWTIAKGGLLKEDFMNAAKTDALYQPG
jgi:4a-hydroxytetrahydrobiopterin dehydratase